MEEFSQLLATTSSNQLGTKLTEELRELTGARTVVLIAETLEQDGPRLASVCPVEDAEMFSQDELGELRRTSLEGGVPRRPEEFPQEHPLRPVLSRLGVESLLSIALRVQDEPPASVVLMNLPDPDLIDETEQVVMHLSAVMALALKNSLNHVRIELQTRKLEAHSQDQEQIVIDRTRELKTANESLTASYREVLGMKEEAIQARLRAEQSAALLLQSTRDLADRNASSIRFPMT